MTDPKRIYFIGIGGIGMSALARIFSKQGKDVAGSDMRDSATVGELKALGFLISIGHSEKNVASAKPELVVYSEDITETAAGFPELKFARDNGIETLSYAQALGRAMNNHFGISVTGTNGKSTTTALLGLILEQAGMDPTVVVGSKLSAGNESPKFKANARLGEGKYFVAEADEYHRHMMEQNPSIIVLTNVAEDHLDYYKDIAEIKTAFMAFIAKLPSDGAIIFNADDHEAVLVAREASAHKLTFGIQHYADLQALNVITLAGSQTFDVHYQDEKIGSVTVKVPGKFNISNMLAAALAAMRLGVGFPDIKKVLENYSGLWRRFERVGKLNNAEIISDYAHHPAGVEGTIQATKDFYPGKRILFVFQPHHRNRTKKLFGEFVQSMKDADNIIIPEIFDVAGREHGETVSSKGLADELIKFKVNAVYAKDLDETEIFIRQSVEAYDVIVMMGAGDIDLLARKLANA